MVSLELEDSLKFLGHNYELHNWDCYSLICKFHGLKPIEYKTSSDIHNYTTADLGFIFNNKVNIISIDKIKNNDILVFATEKQKKLLHFGIFIAPDKMLHIAEGSVSSIQIISEAYRKRLICGCTLT